MSFQPRAGIRHGALASRPHDPDLLDARDALLKYDLAAPGFLGGSISKARDQATEIARRDSAYGRLIFAPVHARAEYAGPEVFLL